MAALGPCCGDSALQAEAGHFTVMTEQAPVAPSGPSVVSTAIAENVTDLDLGGPDLAVGSAGTAHAVVVDEKSAIDSVRRALSYLPDYAGAAAPVVDAQPPTDAEALLTLVPIEDKARLRHAQGDHRDRRPRIAAAVGRDPREVREHGAGADRGRPGRQRGQPADAAGRRPHVEALGKYLAFIEVCDTSNIPLSAGVLRNLERIAVRLSIATVPRVSVIERKPCGAGYFLRGFADRAQGGTEAHDRLFGKLTEEWQLESEPSETRSVIATAIEVTWGNHERVAAGCDPAAGRGQ